MEKAYIRVANSIRSFILDGTYKPSTFIPSEIKLCEILHAGRSTVRKGLKLLVNEGYLLSIQGKGYYVNEPSTGEYVLYFNETAAIETGGSGVIIIDVSIVPADEMITGLLSLTPNKSIVIIERIIKHGDEYAAYDVKYMPYSPKIPIIEQEIATAASPELFAKGKSIFDIHRNMAIKIGSLNKDEAKILHAVVGEPILIFEQLIHDSAGNPVGWSVTKFLGRCLKVKAMSQ